MTDKLTDDVDKSFEAADCKVHAIGITSTCDTYSSNSFPQDIKNIIARLRTTVDHIDSPRNYARDLIHELARQLDERRLCKRGHISIKIKEILEDKIHAGKVTERWIRKCLPPEYKREYIKDKRELSSLSEKKAGAELLSEQTITVGNDGQQTTSNEQLKEPADTLVSNPANLQRSDWNPKTGTESLSPEQGTTKQSTDTTHPSVKYIGQECTSCLELQDQITQLKEALQQISIPTANQILGTEFEFPIPKEKYEMVRDAMDKSKSAIFVKCDETKKFACAVADVDN
jgi:hypothetical protein